MSTLANFRKKPLTLKQERRLVAYLDDQFLQFTRGYKKRSVFIFKIPVFYFIVRTECAISFKKDITLDFGSDITQIHRLCSEALGIYITDSTCGSVDGVEDAVYVEIDGGCVECGCGVYVANFTFGCRRCKFTTSAISN